MNKLIKNKLFHLSDEKYKIFSSKLLPNVNNILGVRFPYLREMAQKIANQNWQSYLVNALDDYFEETMLQAMVIGYVKTDIETILPYWANFVEKINNWSVCDSFCFGLKVTKKEPKIVFDFLQPYFYSQKEYDVRFAVVTLLKWFNQKEFINQNFEILDSINHDGYYSKMAIAWAISVFYIASPEVTLTYLRNNNLDKFIYNKSLQKIRESLKISNKQKEELKFKLI